MGYHFLGCSFQHEEQPFFVFIQPSELKDKEIIYELSINSTPRIISTG